MQLMGEIGPTQPEPQPQGEELAPIQQLEMDLAAARREAAALRDEKAALVEKVRYEAWRYRTLRSRKVWRIFSAIAALRRRPFGLLTLPVVLARIVFGPPVAPPNPRGGDDDDTSGRVPGVAAGAFTARPRAWSMLPTDTTDVELRRWRATLARRPQDPSELVVATVMDEFSQACFAPECDLVTFPPDGWRAILQERTPHLLLLESAWHGNSGSWERRLGNYADTGLGDVTELVQWCRQREIPVAFWNKEDPLHFKRFADAAALCDVVFTTDANAVSRYEALRSPTLRKVEPLPFAAQPRLHNPIAPPQPRTDGVCFAGTFYKQTRGTRSEALEALLDAALPFGLTIYDRMWDNERTDIYGFPERFAECVRPGLPYRQLLPEYKRFAAFLNVNTVEDSPTMFARRVFEILACDTAVVSTRSDGITRMFGGLVPIADDRAGAAAALTTLIGDEAHRRSAVTAARRLVMSQHTYRDRLTTIATTLGFRVDPRGRDRVAALVLVDDADPGVAARAAAELGQQAVPPWEVLVGTTAGHAANSLADRLREALPQARVRIVQQDVGTMGADRRRELAALAAAPWVAPWDVSARYTAQHLADLVAATQFADSDVVGQAPDDAHGVEHEYTDAVQPRAALVRREVVADRGWPDDVGVLRDWHRSGLRYYSADGGNVTVAP